MKIDINSIIAFLKNKKEIVKDINIRESIDAINNKTLDLVATLKPENCNDGQYLILLLATFSQILAGFKAVSLNKNIIDSKAIEDLDKIHSDMINFFKKEIKNEE